MEAINFSFINEFIFSDNSKNKAEMETENAENRQPRQDKPRLGQRAEKWPRDPNCPQPSQHSELTPGQEQQVSD